MSLTTTDDRSDTALLLAYVRDGDEAAFKAVAARHVNMIFAVSLRRSGNRQLAEEATQNVLLSLAKNARSLSAREGNLTGWLHTGTRFEVAKLLRRESRIKLREHTYASENMKTSTQDEDETFQRLIPLLDQAIDHLRAPDREVIVRRYLEGQDFRRIGEALGISEDAAQKRTSRAFDQLNLYFKRTAGLTVSSAALAQGISRHCAEAAPDACMNFVTETVSSGLTSTLTTATLATMSIGKTAAVTAAVLILAGGIAWLATQEDPPLETASVSSEISSPPPPQPGSPASATPPETVAQQVEASLVGGALAAPAENEKPYSPNEELARLEAMNPHPNPEEMARRLSVKQERLLKDLTRELALNAAQAASLKGVLEARLKAFRASLDIGPLAGGSPEDFAREEAMVTKAGGLIRGAGLRDELAGILSEQQIAAFDEHQAKALQNEVEAHAYKELAKLTPVLRLTEAQKDRAFELLQSSSAEKLKESADVRAFMALRANQPASLVEVTDRAEAKFLFEALDGPNPMQPNSPEFKKRITEVVGGQIQKEVGLLAPILDPAQKQRYREHLYGKSTLAIFGIKLPSP